jgi:uncharacterized protein YbjT (DUF2867 family)
MNVLLFGASGMVGQGVLRECLLASDVARVVTVVRKPLGQQHDKLRELVVADLEHPPADVDLKGFDACFFCLGVSSGGMNEADYTRLTYDLTMRWAEPLSKQSPQATFVYVSGEGTDSSEKGRSMWARVKGRTENAILALPFKAAFMFRPGIIRPMHGEVSKQKLYRVFYVLLGWLIPVFQRVAPGLSTNTEQVGRAMLKVAREGSPQKHLDTRAINALVL